MKTENRIVALPDYDSDFDYSEIDIKIDEKMDIL